MTSFCESHCSNCGLKGAATGGGNCASTVVSGDVHYSGSVGLVLLAPRQLSVNSTYIILKSSFYLCLHRLPTTSGTLYFRDSWTVLMQSETAVLQ